MTISSVVYREQEVIAHEDIETAKVAEGTTWVRVMYATADDYSRLSDVFGIHPLAIEDVVNNTRPKTEMYSEYTFVLIKAAELTRGDTTFDEEVTADPIGVFIGRDWVITIATQSDEPVGRVWDSVVQEDQRLLQRGPDFTAYRVIDMIVDEYFILLDRIEDQIEAVEEEVIVSTEIETLEVINGVRRDLLSFRKIAWPTRDALGVLARGDPDQVQQTTEKYYRDVFDHLIQIVDLIATYRDLVSGARDIYLNALSQSTNEVMKVLTVVATIFLPLTFVVGIYGMNFSGSPFNMPELAWTYGYPAVMIGLLLVSVTLLWYFRRLSYL